MHKESRILLSTLLGSAALAASPAVAADMKALAGTYSFVAVSQTNAQGQKNEPFGASPQGLIVLTPEGRYVSALMKQGLPKFAGNMRAQATPEENKAVVEGSLAHYGKYAVEGDTIIFHIEKATFPNWDGTTQRRTFKVEGDRLVWRVPASASAAGSAEVVMQRVK